MKNFIFIFAFFYGLNFCNAQPIKDSIIRLDSAGLINQCNNKNPVLKSLIVPTALITYGFVSLNTKSLRQLDKNTQREIAEDHPKFKTKIDNYLQYSPAFAVFGLNAIGIKGKNNLRDRSMIYALSTIISATAVLSIKRIKKIERPDKSAANSFPSGHTTTAFAAAEFLRQEYKDVSPWYGIAGYTAAAATGTLRLYNNKHWLSDIVAGAGLGILSTKLSYWVYPVIKRRLFKNRNTNAVFVPYYQNGGGGIAFAYHFNH